MLGAAFSYNAGMAGYATRRWFQFRLRTLLIGVVLIGGASGYVAHEVRIVAARKSWIAAHPVPMALFPLLKEGDGHQVPLIRRWLGDEKQGFVLVDSKEEIATAEALFPEANICSLGIITESPDDWVHPIRPRPANTPPEQN